MRLLSPTFILLLLLIGVPILEIAIFIQLGGWIGIAPTLLTIVATAVIGTALIRRHWMGVMARASREADAGRTPVRELFQAICLLAAGLLLLTPGFATDAAGFLLLTPPVQTAIGAALSQRIVGWVRQRAHEGGFASTGPFPGGPRGGGPRKRQPGGGVIDAEFEVVDPDTPDPLDQPDSPDEPKDDGVPSIGPDRSRWGRGRE